MIVARGDVYTWSGVATVRCGPRVLSKNCRSQAVGTQSHRVRILRTDASRQTTAGSRVRRTPEAVATHRLASQWSRFEANHPAQRKLGFLVLIIAELEERHGEAANARRHE